MRSLYNCFITGLAALLFVGSAAPSLASGEFYCGPQYGAISFECRLGFSFTVTGAPQPYNYLFFDGVYTGNNGNHHDDTRFRNISIFNDGGNQNFQGKTVGELVPISFTLPTTVALGTNANPDSIYTSVPLNWGSRSFDVEVITAGYDKIHSFPIIHIDFDGAAGTGSVTSDPVFPPDTPEVTGEFYMIDSEGLIAKATPGETLEMLIDFASDDPDVTRQQLVDEVAALGFNPRIALEGVQLANGDTITFSTPTLQPVSGVIQTGSGGELLWTGAGTEVVETSRHTELVRNADGSYSSRQVTNVTTSTTDENGSTTVTTSKINTETGETEGRGQASSKDGQDRGDMTAAEERAGALAEAEAAEAEGQAEGSAVFDGEIGSVTDSLTESAEKLSASTESLKGKLSDYRPFENLSVGTQSSYSMTWEIGEHSVPVTFPLDHPSIAILRAIELFLISLSGVRMFFRILIV